MQIFVSLTEFFNVILNLNSCIKSLLLNQMKKVFKVIKFNQLLLINNFMRFYEYIFFINYLLK